MLLITVYRLLVTDTREWLVPCSLSFVSWQKILGNLVGHIHNLAMIVHITTRTAWESAGTLYMADSLDSEGFIHCSTLEQVLLPANERFRGQTGLVLLCIEPARVTADIVYEDCYESGQKFPHIYGPLNKEAVTRVVDFPPNPDGTFSLPSQVAYGK